MPSPFLNAVTMKSILIDIGNSTYCKTALSDGKRILSVKRMEREQLCMELEREVLSDSAADAICMSSVAGDNPGLENWLQGHCRRFIRLNSSTPMPLHLDYDTPETLGADRIAAAIGAHALFPGKDCIIFDFGTALTVDFISGSGIFKGGNISPGLSMRFKAINQYTSLLPLVSPSTPSRQEGRSTAEAINNGVVLGIMFEVERYINRNPGSTVIFTGGDALFFAKKLKTPIFVACNLVLTGLSKIVQLNV